MRKIIFAALEKQTKTENAIQLRQWKTLIFVNFYYRTEASVIEMTSEFIEETAKAMKIARVKSFVLFMD